MRLSNRASFVLFASTIVTFLAGSSLPTPLYPTYQAAWGFSPITVTVVFGIYAIAVLATLLVLGSLSDYVGRRPVIIAGALVEVAAMFAFMTADGVATLIAARVVQGVGVGAAATAAGAAMLDLDRERGTVGNAAAPGLGTATGALLSGLFVQFLPAPTLLGYAVLAGVIAAQAVAVYFAPETATKQPVTPSALRPRLRVPAELRRDVLLAAPALVAAWALAGFYGSLGPALVRRVADSHAPALGGLGLGTLAAAGVATIVVSRARTAKATVRLGAAALTVGVGAVILAIATGSTAGFFAATLVAGVGFGASFHGGMRSVLSIAAVEQRAAVLSVLYVIAYLSMGVPAVIGGVFVVHGHGIIGTAYEYGAVVIALAAAAMAGTFAARRAAIAPAVETVVRAKAA